MSIKKIAKYLSCMTLFFMLNNDLAFAYPYVVGYHSINNSSVGDYKTDENVLESLSDSVGKDGEFSEIINYSTEQTIKNDSEIISYLIEHNVLGKDLEISFDNGEITTTTFEPFKYGKTDVISKSDFLVTLAKAVYGIQPSRTLVYKSDKAIRTIDGESEELEYSSEYVPKKYEHIENPEDFEDEDLNVVDFSKGDYWTFITPNVYELYFKLLVDKGFLDPSEFSNVQMVGDLTYYSSGDNGTKVLPSWSNEIGYYGIGVEFKNSFKVFGENPIGQSFKIDENGNTTYEPVEWFFTEDITLIDALSYVESILRVTEKDMTETEATIINYKYGSIYLNNLPEDAKRTVSFLIAKGILNFEDPSEFKDLYKPLMGDMFVKVIYRILNPNGRLDFSKVQLTDNDNYWISNGFIQGELQVLDSSTDYPLTDTVITEVESVSYTNGNNGFIKTRPSVIADGGFKTYSITRSFYPSITYYYKGVKVSSSMNTSDFKEIKSIETTKNSNGKNIIKITFEVEATSEHAAIAMLDTYTMIDDNGTKVIGSVPTFNTFEYDKDGKSKTVRYVSQDTLKLLDLPIKVVEDKYLVNTDTGTRALLLQDNKVAIVGNEVLHYNSTIVFDLNGTTHYNFWVIAKLLGDTYIDEIDPNSVYVTKSNGATAGANYKLVSKRGDEYTDLGVTDVRKITQGNSTDNFYNISLSNSLSNFMIMDVGPDLGLSHRLYMIVEFNYVTSKKMNSLLGINDISTYINKTASVREVLDFAYKEPSGSSMLSEWWTTNLEFNNALVNYMIGTKDVSYIKSGYLVPTISFLGADDKEVAVDKIDKLFNEKLALSGTVKNLKFGEGNFVQNFFNFNGSLIPSGDSNYDYIRQSRKINVYKKSNGKDDDYKYYKDFVVSASYQIYKSEKSTEGLVIDNKNSIMYKETVKSEVNGITVGGLYSIEHDGKFYKYRCDSIDGSYTTFNAITGIKTKFKGNKSDWTLKYKDKDVQEYLKKLNKDLTGDKVQTSGLVSMTYRPSVDLLKEGDVAFGGNNFYIVENGKLRKLELNKRDDLKIVKNNDVLVFHQISSYNNSIDFKDDNVLSLDITNLPYFSINNFTTVGIMDNILDSLLYNCSDYKSFSELPANSSVIIGDLVFTKSSDSLVSGIIETKTLGVDFAQTELGNGTSTGKGGDAIKSLVSKIFANYSIGIINKGLLEDSNLFSSYITYCAIGNSSKADFSNTLVRTKSGLQLKTKGSSATTYETGMVFSSTIITIKITDDLKFRPIGNGSKKYALVTTTTTNSDGYVNNIPYYNETLSYVDDKDFGANLDKTLFQASGNAADVFNKFRDLFREKQNKDIISLIRYWINRILMVLVFTNLMCAYLKHTVVDIIFKSIKYPGDGRDGPDLYKWLTAGIQDYETEMSYTKALFLGFILFAILAVLGL